MSPPDTDTFAVLCAADPDVMDRDELAVLTGHLARIRPGVMRSRFASPAVNANSPPKVALSPLEIC